MQQSILYKEIKALTNHMLVDARLFQTAMSHRSAVASREHSNERLEFLGDAILGAHVAELLYRKWPSELEGALSKARAGLVCRSSLAKCARRIELERFIRLGKNEMGSSAEQLDSVLADCFEALVGALFVDGGAMTSGLFVRTTFGPQIDAADHPRALYRSDAKTQLQEYLQAHGGATPFYKLLDKRGPSHAPVFTTEVRQDSEVLARGQGTSRKAAEQDAAERALLRSGDSCLQVFDSQQKQGENT